MNLKIITNIKRLEKAQVDGVTLDVTFFPEGMGTLKAGWLVFKESFGKDYVVVNCNTACLCIQGLLHLLVFFNRSRLVSVDSVLPVPVSISDKLKAALIGLCFKGVDIFIEYFRVTNGVTKYYGVSPDKFRYVPFKINRHQKVLKKVANNEIGDDGYIFCGGNTRRDFSTLIEAAKYVDYPVKIVTMANTIIETHGSYLDETRLPPNIEVIRHDGSDTFLDYIARARVVVIPIKSANITASGIGVYVTAMGLKKCVIISSGVSVDEIITDEAIIVPPEDPVALRGALTRAFEDQEYRQGFEARAHAYAMALGGEKRLYSSLIEELVEDRMRAKSVK